MTKALVILLAITSITFAQEPKTEPKQPKKGQQKSPKEAIDQAVAFLKSTQAADGSWGGPTAGGMTGIVVEALVKGGGLTAEDPAVAKAVKFIEGLIDPTEGGIAGPQAKVGQLNYPTSVNILALKAVDPEGKKYKAAVDAAAKLLLKIQWDESEDKKKTDVIYGGAGYGGGTRPDLSNTHFFLDALVAAGVPVSDPAFQKATVFISRCQNLKGEHNDQPWAGSINDGSFIYTAAGDTRGTTTADGKKPGYGSMTYAGVKCLMQCGVGKDDPRIAAARKWLATHYTVDVNPGMAPGSGGRGLYYYLLVMSKCLDLVGEPTMTVVTGEARDWKADITASILTRQRKDGSWMNDTAAWMETNPDLCTAYALLTLARTKPAAK